MKVSALVVTIVPSNKSPLAPVVKVPLLGALLLPCVTAGEASRELLVATPEYSRMAKRKGPRTDCVTVMVSGPPLMFSA
jgi:hypothetical protein